MILGFQLPLFSPTSFIFLQSHHESRLRLVILNVSVGQDVVLTAQHARAFSPIRRLQRTHYGQDTICFSDWIVSLTALTSHTN